MMFLLLCCRMVVCGMMSLICLVFGEILVCMKVLDFVLRFFEMMVCME